MLVSNRLLETSAFWPERPVGRAVKVDPVSSESEVADRLLAIEPRIVRGHIMKGDCRARAGDGRVAINFYKSAMLIARDQQPPADVAADLRGAEGAVAQLEERLDLEREATLAARGFEPGRRSPRFQQSLDIVAGRERIFVQEPTAYYFPGLPQIQFFERESFD